MSDHAGHDHIDVPPGTVLDAREGFVKRLTQNGYTPEQLFDLLVFEQHVTLRFFVEYASKYGV